MAQEPAKEDQYFVNNHPIYVKDEFFVYRKPSGAFAFRKVSALQALDKNGHLEHDGDLFVSLNRETAVEGSLWKEFYVSIFDEHAAEFFLFSKSEFSDQLRVTGRYVLSKAYYINLYPIFVNVQKQKFMFRQRDGKVSVASLHLLKGYFALYNEDPTRAFKADVSSLNEPRNTEYALWEDFSISLRERFYRSFSLIVRAGHEDPNEDAGEYVLAMQSFVSLHPVYISNSARRLLFLEPSAGQFAITTLDRLEEVIFDYEANPEEADDIPAQTLSLNEYVPVYLSEWQHLELVIDNEAVPEFSLFKRSDGSRWRTYVVDQQRRVMHDCLLYLQDDNKTFMFRQHNGRYGIAVISLLEDYVRKARDSPETLLAA